MLTIKVE